jgi:hypothetical protein
MDNNTLNYASTNLILFGFNNLNVNFKVFFFIGTIAAKDNKNTNRDELI